MGSIANVIKYEGDNTTFIWKHPIEEFNTGSQLIVHESQEAIFFMNGQALDLFGPGRHTLDSQNLPYVRKFYNEIFDGETPFHCEIYFINKVEQMAIKWGTDSKVEYIDPTYGFPLKIGASGQMNLRAQNSRKLLVKVVGTEIGITQQMLVNKFRAFLTTRIKTYLAHVIKKNKINIFAIDEQLTKMSQDLMTKLTPDFSDYGVALERFFVTTIVKPEGDRSYQKFKQLHFRKYTDVAEAELRQKIGVIDQTTEAKRMVIEAKGLAEKRSTEGYTYQQEREFDVAERVASNEGVGEMSNIGIGLGMMTGVGATVGNTVGNMMKGTMDDISDQNTTEQKSSPLHTTQCTKCGKPLPSGAKFCLECGTKIEHAGDDKITCPKCNHTTPKGKFCMNCGEPLQSICPNCSKTVPSGAKFCLECGHKL